MIVQINRSGEIVNTFDSLEEVKESVGQLVHDVKKVVGLTPGRHSAGGHFWIEVPTGRSTPVVVAKNNRVVRAFPKLSQAENLIGKRAECISMHVRGKAYAEGINGYTVKSISL